ncbi:MAG: hypothetical protein IH840_07885 [Candidatus Heimdallarchaeota archaeon]|nr:hypothetical protein [Candidatus Heimdallarchaeota archaeon]
MVNINRTHGIYKFTRPGIIEIPEHVTIVVGRPHDQTHLIGGQIVLIDFEGKQIPFLLVDCSR